MSLIVLEPLPKLSGHLGCHLVQAVPACTTIAVAAAWFLLRRARRRLAGEAVEDEAAEDEAGPAGGALEDEAVEDEAGPAGGAMEDEAAEDEAAEEGLLIKFAAFSRRDWLSKAILIKVAAFSRRCR